MSILDERIEKLKVQGRFYDIIKEIKGKLPEIKSQNKKIRLEFQLAETYYTIRNFNEAKKLAEELLPVVTKLDNQLMIGNIENLLGKIYRIHQRYSEAITHYQNAEKAFEKAEDQEGLSKIYHNFGNVYIFLEQFKEAKKFHYKALKIAEQEGKKNAIASSNLNIGSMFYQNGEIDQAISHFKKALVLFEEIDDKPNLAVSYHNLAETYLLRRDFSNAQKFSQKAVTLYEKQRNSLGQRLALITLARSKKALGALEEAIDIYNQIINQNKTEDILLELGECFLEKNQVEDAERTFRLIKELSTHTPRGIGFSLDYLAKVAIYKKEYEKALNLYTELVEVLNEMEPKDTDSMASTYGNLGYMYLKTGNTDRAWELLNSVNEYFTKRKIWDELHSLGRNYCTEFVSLCDYDQAISVFLKILIPTAKKAKNVQTENQYYYETALLYSLKGNTDEGIQYWEKNHSKKIRFQKFSVQMLLSDLETSKKEEIEKQHRIFLKKLLNNEKTQS